jgi:hypothetical protein
MEDPHHLCIAEIPGADPKTRHPVKGFFRGIGNVGLLIFEAAVALLDLFRPLPSEDKPRKARRRPHPIEKSASFPIND